MRTASILQNITYNQSKPAVEILLETAFTKEIRLAFKRNQVMKQHQTPLPIVVEIVEGHIDFSVEAEILSLHKGDLVALEGGVPHSLDAKQDSIVRLTISKKDRTERVEQAAAR